MRPKLTWRVRRWSEGSWIEPLPQLRERYGDAVAEVVESARDRARDLADQPSAQDLKATLQRIADAPHEADITRLDPNTDARLLQHSWRRYRVQRIEALTLEQLSTCARDALAELAISTGRPPKDELATRLVRDLLQLMPAEATVQARDAMLTDALLACGFGASPENLRRLLRSAG
jgi:hypothetical protein